MHLSGWWFAPGGTRVVILRAGGVPRSGGCSHPAVQDPFFSVATSGSWSACGRATGPAEWAPPNGALESGPSGFRS